MLSSWQVRGHYFPEVIEIWKKLFNRIYFVLPPRCIVFRFRDFTYAGLIDTLVQALVAMLWDFFNTLTMLLPIVRVWIGSIVGIYIF